MSLAVKSIQFSHNLLQRISLFPSLGQATQATQELLRNANGPVVLSFVNAHAFNLNYTDPEFHRSLASSDIILRDGIGMAILFKTLGIDPGINCNGTDFIPYLLDHLPLQQVALLGTAQPYLDRAAGVLQQKGKTIVLKENGFLSMDSYVHLTLQARPQIIVLGMGMPKQEKVAALLKRSLPFPCLIINGGAIIDFLGQKVSRAPRWVRRIGMEWMYRLLLEPRRMFRRYVIGNYLFLKRMFFLQKWERFGRSVTIRHKPVIINPNE